MALNLLFKGAASKIILNDADPAIYAVWYALLNHASEFIQFINEIPINTEEYHKQRKIYDGANRSIKELDFATFYLNRTNRSGILSAGPIGGLNQEGNYLMDCRFNRKALSTRVKCIYNNRHLIEIYNEDARVFLRRIFPNNAFLFIDPPYYNKGAQLYRNYFNHEDHLQVASLVRNLKYPWVVTYDNVKPVIEMYDFSHHKEYDISYTVETKRIGNEIMFYSPLLCM